MSSMAGIIKSTQECTICNHYNEVPVATPTSTCSHLPDVCGLCLHRQTNSILLRETRAKSCPTAGCTSEFSKDDMRRWANPEVGHAAFLSDLEKDKFFVRCLKGNCTAGQYHAGGDKEPIVKCYSCGAKQCFLHRTPWHENMTCSQWKRQERRKANDMSRVVIHQETKNCPNCRAPIHKSQGCDVMACICDFKFCYACLAPYQRIQRRGNHYHRRRCPHFAPKTGRSHDRSKARWWEFWDSRWWRRARWDSGIGYE